MLSDRTRVASLLVLAGSLLLYTVGFAYGPKMALHNFAHDARHAMSFPCH